MQKAERIVSVINIAFGAFVIYLATEYPFESKMIPVLYSILYILLSAILFIGSFKKEKIDASKEMPETEDLFQVFKVSLVFLAYIASIPFVGFYVSTLLFMAFFMIVTKASKLRATLAISFSATALLFVFFEWALHIPTPRGVLF